MTPEEPSNGRRKSCVSSSKSFVAITFSQSGPSDIMDFSLAPDFVLGLFKVVGQ